MSRESVSEAVNTLSAEQTTINAVVEEANRIRTAASNQMLQDPYAKPYYPTTAGARRLAQIKAKAEVEKLAHATPQEYEAARAEGYRLAIVELQHRAHQADLAYRADCKESTEIRNNHRGFLKRTARDRDDARRSLTFGRRLDDAMASLAVVASAPASQALDAVHVTGGGEPGSPTFPGDPVGRARAIARDAVRQVERELESARRRMLEDEPEGKAA